MTSEGHLPEGISNLVTSVPAGVLAFYYFRWFQEDTREKRVGVTKGYKFQVYFYALLFIVLAIFVLALPSDQIPDDLMNPEGTKEKLDDKKKMEIKVALVIAVCMLGCLITWFFYYFYTVSVKWSTYESLLEGVPE